MGGGGGRAVKSPVFNAVLTTGPPKAKIQRHLNFFLVTVFLETTSIDTNFENQTSMDPAQQSKGDPQMVDTMRPYLGQVWILHARARPPSGRDPSSPGVSARRICPKPRIGGQTQRLRTYESWAPQLGVGGFPLLK